MKTSIISIDKDGKRTTLCTFSTKKEAVLALNKINDLEKAKKECSEELQKRDIKLEEYTYELEKAKDEDLTWHERLITHDTNGCHPIWGLILLLIGTTGFDNLGNNINNNN